MRRFLFFSVILISILLTAPSVSAAVLFGQPDTSGVVNHSGSRFFNLGAGADGTANQIKLKFEQPLEITGQKHFAIFIIEEHNNNSYTSLNQPVYDRPPASEFNNDGTNVFCYLGNLDELIFEFDDFNFRSDKFYRIAAGYLFNADKRVCEGRAFAGKGFNFNAKYEADSSGNIFFEVGNNLGPVTRSPDPVVFNQEQFHFNGIARIGEGGSTEGGTVAFSAKLSSILGNDVKLQIELRETSELFTGIDDDGIFESGFVSSGNTATISGVNAPPGEYHWRARGVDSEGNISDWVEFEAPGNTDFVMEPDVLDTVITRSPDKNHESSGSFLAIEQTLGTGLSGEVDSLVVNVRWSKLPTAPSAEFLEVHLFEFPDGEYRESEARQLFFGFHSFEEANLDVRRDYIFTTSTPITLNSSKYYAFRIEGRGGIPIFYTGGSPPGEDAYTNGCLAGTRHAFSCNLINDPAWVGDIYFELGLASISQGIDPVIIVPGIMGSRLNRVSDGEEVWPNISEMRTPFNDKDAYLNELKLDENGEQVSERAMEPTEILDKVVIKTIYGDLINSFTSQGYASGTTLFTVPYDWRLDLADEVGRLDTVIQRALTNSSSGKVNIIAHSMGGMLVKKYLNNLADTSFVDKLIIAGVPQLGAPKAFKVLSYGDNMEFEDPIFGIDILNPERVKIISQNMPGVYELLPSRRYVDVNGGYVKDFRDGVEILNYDNTTQFMEDSGRNRLLLDEVDSFHQSLDNSPFNASDVYNIMGCQNPETIGEIRIYEDGKYKITPVDGDGTVPLTSAFNLASGYSNYFALNSETEINHTDLIRDDKTIELINNIINGFPNDFASGISTSAASCLEELPDSNKIIFSSHSPVELHIYNSIGEHLGPNSDGDIELGILNSSYQIIEGNNFAFVPAGDTYEIVLEAKDSGDFDFEIEQYNGTELVEKVTYLGIPLPSGETVASLNFADTASDLTLGLDNDGNDIVDELFQPNAILDVETAGDITPPVISFNIPSEVLLNTPLPLSLDVTDDLSGVEIVEANLDGVPVNAGDVVAISEVGEHTLRVKAVDRAGNPNIEEVYFRAVYNFGGFLPPIKSDKQKEYNPKQALPVKFRLTDYNGDAINDAVATLTATNIDDGRIVEQGEFRYDEEDEQYIFNLKLNSLGVGDWQLRISLDDGKSHEADISIRE